MDTITTITTTTTTIIIIIINPCDQWFVWPSFKDENDNKE